MEQGKERGCWCRVQKTSIPRLEIRSPATNPDLVHCPLPFLAVRHPPPHPLRARPETGRRGLWPSCNPLLPAPCSLFPTSCPCYCPWFRLCRQNTFQYHTFPEIPARLACPQSYGSNTMGKRVVWGRGAAAYGHRR